ncbi:unnamed protein product [Choristocarpus tenellus]
MYAAQESEERIRSLSIRKDGLEANLEELSEARREEVSGLEDELAKAKHGLEFSKEEKERLETKLAELEIEHRNAQATQEDLRAMAQEERDRRQALEQRLNEAERVRDDLAAAASRAAAESEKRRRESLERRLTVAETARDELAASTATATSMAAVESEKRRRVSLERRLVLAERARDDLATSAANAALEAAKIASAEATAKATATAAANRAMEREESIKNQIDATPAQRAKGQEDAKIAAAPGRRVREQENAKIAAAPARKAKEKEDTKVTKSLVAEGQEEVGSIGDPTTTPLLLVESPLAGVTTEEEGVPGSSRGIGRAKPRVRVRSEAEDDKTEANNMSRVKRLKGKARGKIKRRVKRKSALVDEGVSLTRAELRGHIEMKLVHSDEGGNDDIAGEERSPENSELHQGDPCTSPITANEDDVDFDRAYSNGEEDGFGANNGEHEKKIELDAVSIGGRVTEEGTEEKKREMEGVCGGIKQQDHGMGAGEVVVPIAGLGVGQEEEGDEGGEGTGGGQSNDPMEAFEVEVSASRVEEDVVRDVTTGVVRRGLSRGSHRLASKSVLSYAEDVSDQSSDSGDSLPRGKRRKFKGDNKSRKRRVIRDSVSLDGAIPDVDEERKKENTSSPPSSPHCVVSDTQGKKGKRNRKGSHQERQTGVVAGVQSNCSPVVTRDSVRYQRRNEEEIVASSPSLMMGGIGDNVKVSKSIEVEEGGVVALSSPPGGALAEVSPVLRKGKASQRRKVGTITPLQGETENEGGFPETQEASVDAEVAEEGFGETGGDDGGRKKKKSKARKKRASAASNRKSLLGKRKSIRTPLRTVNANSMESHGDSHGDVNGGGDDLNNSSTEDVSLVQGTSVAASPVSEKDKLRQKRVQGTEKRKRNKAGVKFEVKKNNNNNHLHTGKTVGEEEGSSGVEEPWVQEGDVENEAVLGGNSNPNPMGVIAVGAQPETVTIKVPKEVVGSKSASGSGGASALVHGPGARSGGLGVRNGGPGEGKGKGRKSVLGESKQSEKTKRLLAGSVMGLKGRGALRGALFSGFLDPSNGFKVPKLKSNAKR